MAGKGTVQMARQRHINRPEFNNSNSNSNNEAKRTLLVYGIAFILFGVFVLKLPSADATQLQPRQDANANRSGGKICRSVDIRNSFSSNDSLRGCTVVEGFVQILLFDNVNETEMSMISYPELTEITDYLLLYRVNGLRSIGQLFPNLAVIRGQNPFYAYSLVIFEMSSLLEIGLYSLAEITRGSVRIDKNPSLCFVNTIDWDRITQEANSNNFIRPSKPDNECPICPGAGDKSENENEDIKPCPLQIIKDKKVNVCWNRHHCQKICPKDCKACNSLGKCCDPSCIGGCSDTDIKECTVCRNFTVAPNKCSTKCPPNEYKFLGRRCVTKEECISMEAPIKLQQQSYNKDEMYPYKIFEDECNSECPINYMSDNHTCKPCHGKCRKECPGTNVDSIASAQTLRGCTHITGPLEIQIRGGRKVVSVLEENLSMIQEIDDYLKIVRSFPLISLSFLKNLRLIKGKNKESQKYAFIALDNQNLQSIWDWKNRTLKIENNGRLFFHFNPKLCLELIDELQNRTGLYPPYTDLEVAKNSNGDKIACNTTELFVNYTAENKSALLMWKQFEIDDQRKLLGYIVYTIPAPKGNVTLYDGRDACGEEDWKVDDVTIPEDPKVTIRHIITNLVPYTRYAFYVKTYTIATERRGAQSRIQYFRTKPATPTSPRFIKISEVGTNSLKVSWKPPSHRNGNVTYYIVSGKKHVNTQSDSFDRYYCDKYETAEQIQIIPTTEAPPLSEKTNNTEKCSCEELKENRLSRDEAEELSRIQFEDELHNQVYIRKSGPTSQDNSKRTKRDTEMIKNANQSNAMSTTNNSNNVNINNDILNKTENGGFEFWYLVRGEENKFIDNLHHFTFYNIYVKACREKEGNETVSEETHCSSTAIASARTRKKEGADDITEIWKTNQTLDSVTISWEQPSDPNGVIVNVRVEFSEIIDGRFMYFNKRCILMKELKNGTNAYTIDKLTAGNYSIRVVAISSAGDGNPSPRIFVNIKGPASQTVIIVVTVLVLTLVMIAAIVYLVYQKRFKGEKDRLIPSVNPEYVSSVYVPDEWEVPRKKIELIKELGQGSFGMVYEGIAKNICGNASMRCAVKTVNEHATNRERDEFLNEASVMKAFDTAHVVRLLGVVSQSQPTLVIMELMANGDLKSYLRSHRPDDERNQSFDPATIRHPPTLKQIYGMAIEIADGMAYLAAKKFVHRDLAARNCMVAEDLTVKIGDFGMTRDIYETDYYRKGTKGLLPVRWMAPESLKDGVFTSSSDVWSYGVVLWEMATLASQPYQGLSNEQVLRYVIDGGVMERPEKCPDKLYTLMRLCWQHKPSERPSFLKLCSLLIDEAKPNFISVSFYHSAAGLEARMNRPTPSPSQDEQTTPLRTAAGYTPSDSQESDTEIDIPTNTHIQFPSITNGSDRLTTANGYVSGCTSNGAGTSQC